MRWLELESMVARAKTLQWEHSLQEKAAKYASVKRASDEASTLKAAVEQTVCPSEDEVMQAQSLAVKVSGGIL